MDDTREFRFEFDELLITARDLELLMGFYPGILPDPFPGMITSALEEASGLFDIRAGYRRKSDVVFLAGTWQFKVDNLLFSPGKIIFSQVRNALEIVFFAGTAGERVTHRCRELHLQGETVYSFVLDLLGSVVAEKTVERIADHLVREAGLPFGTISESFSPGYCNWDVAEQQLLFSLLPAGFCGISLSPSSLMSPVKSVSGIIGAGPSMKRSGYHCRFCKDRTCIYRKLRNREE